MSSDSQKKRTALRQHVRKELAKIHKIATAELSRIQQAMDSPTYDGIGADWPESYSDYMDDRDALSALVGKDALWNPTDAQIDVFGSLEAVVRDLQRYVTTFCDVYGLKKHLKGRLKKAAKRSKGAGKMTRVEQPPPVQLSNAPDVKLAALLGDPASRETLWRKTDERAMLKQGAWSQWGRAICKRDPQAGFRVAAAIASVVEPIYRAAYPNDDGGFQNMCSGIDDWILCPCDLHAEHLSGLWNCAMDTARGSRYGVGDGRAERAAKEAADTLLTAIAFVGHSQKELTWAGHRAVSFKHRTPNISHHASMLGDAAKSSVKALSIAHKISELDASSRVLARVGSDVAPLALGTADPLADRCRCSKCGAAWSSGAFTEGCKQCDGGAMLRSCGDCGGRCGSVWVRFVEASKRDNKAYWSNADLCKKGRS